MDFNHVKWIGSGVTGGAPHFRAEFQLSALSPAVLLISGVGFYELYLNGRRVGDQVLDPIVTVYDRRVRFVRHDVTEHLKPGLNTVGVILGTGWFNCPAKDVWNFDHATWLDKCKFALKLYIGGELRLTTSARNWLCTASGPITFDSLRNGEYYDARLELPGWCENGFDASGWESPLELAPPGGILEEQTSPPCKVMRRIEPVTLTKLPDGAIIADFGVNLTGWCRIRVRGRAGQAVELRYGERLFADGHVDKEHIGKFVLSGENQFDRYILKGGGAEEWAPRFTFHGFQYCQIDTDAELEAVTAEFVYTSFAQIGSVESSAAEFNQLLQATGETYRGNFVGIPSDCPHREKNGWTGDTQLACETGLCCFDAATSLEQWLDTLADCQRPSGQLPGIAPTSGWGYNWGSGPAWDAALFVIPETIYLYTGRRRAFETHFGAMLRYLDYAFDRATDDLVCFGLGDWNHVDPARMAPAELTDSFYLYCCTRLAAKFARRLNRPVAAELEARAARVRDAVNRRYYNGDGSYAHDEMTSLGGALFHGVAPETERAVIAARLDRIVREHRYIPDFGILGSKAVPRALADAGYVETAYRMFTQPEYPGWIHWLRQGATTLWGNWHGEASRNHIMFGDVAAWSFRYLGGLAPDEDAPGFSKVTLRPNPVPQLEFFNMCHETPRGRIEVRWTNRDGEFRVDAKAPEGVECKLELPEK